jgi:hypothetical protein
VAGSAGVQVLARRVEEVGVGDRDGPAPRATGNQRDPSRRYVAIGRLLLRVFGTGDSFRYATLGAAIGGLIIWQWAVLRFRLIDAGLPVSVIFVAVGWSSFKEIRRGRNDPKR